jgi:basic amino acid/polyamine antiporter, APA family
MTNAECRTSDAMPNSSSAPAEPRPQLSLFDSTNIIVGIIIGATIYQSSPLIASGVDGLAGLAGIWVLGAVLSLVGALCYAELANAYPRAGGDYHYVTKAFGRWAGFLFAWAQLWVVRPGSIGAMAYIFASYLSRFWPGAGNDPQTMVLLAAGSVFVLTAVNLLGVREGKWTQNVLTTVKVLSLLAVTMAGFCFAAPAGDAPRPVASEATAPLSVALIFVMFAYGGWNEMAYVAAEVRDPKRNILRAMILGTVAVGAVYLAATFAFIHCLGLEGLRHSNAVAADVLRLAVGPWAEKAVSLMIAIYALGAINGQIFTGARIYYAMGQDHPLYAPLGRWSGRRDTPVWSLLIQGAITLATIVAFGLSEPSAVASSGFDRMVIFTTPLFWGFLFLVGAAVFVLRYREPRVERPYRVPLYPLIPLVFCGSALFMCYQGVNYCYQNGGTEGRWMLVALAAGLVASLVNRKPSAGGGQKPTASDRAAL